MSTLVSKINQDRSLAAIPMMTDSPTCAGELTPVLATPAALATLAAIVAVDVTVYAVGKAICDALG